MATFFKASETDMILKVSITLLIHVLNSLQMPNITTI